DASRFLTQDFYYGGLSNLSLSVDPLTQNRYGLASGNPISFREWDGHMVLDGGGGAATTPTPSPTPGPQPGPAPSPPPDTGRGSDSRGSGFDPFGWASGALHAAQKRYSDPKADVESALEAVA